MCFKQRSDIYHVLKIIMSNGWRVELRIPIRRLLPKFRKEKGKDSMLLSWNLQDLKMDPMCKVRESH